MIDSKRLYSVLTAIDGQRLKKVFDGSGIDMYAFEFAVDHGYIKANSYIPIATSVKTYQFPIVTVKGREEIKRFENSKRLHVTLLNISKKFWLVILCVLGAILTFLEKVTGILSNMSVLIN
ncbi:hypothetical protein [Marinomonas sp. FW-1]|uniref:hypothetical protein n=1 Tax=Marinomonas sp. FW-1 TaxID=2071621 RepID=UPI0010BF9206|nr:hypothetical protein [Marinomonas sp. FW-1]